AGLLPVVAVALLLLIGVLAQPIRAAESKVKTPAETKVKNPAQSGKTKTQAAAADGASSKSTRGPIIKDVLVVRQNGKVFNNSEMYLSDGACRFLARNGDIIIAARAPSWDIVVYSKSRNYAMKMTLAESDKQKFGLLNGVVHLDCGVKRP